jgi:transcriptional regulator with XRE-family HTH domain
MAAELGAWLRQQREARGWSKAEMARRLVQAGRAADDKSMPGIDGMVHNLHRWENGEGGVSERHKLHYCRALGIHPSQFGPGAGPRTLALPVSPASPAVPLLAQVTHAVPDLGDPRVFLPAVVAYRGMQEPDLGDSAVEREVLMAAHEGGEQAEQAEQRGIGDATLDQLRADVTRLSRELMTGAPLPLFLEMRRVRSRINDALDRRMWPRDATTLYFLLGCLNDLIGVAADDLGYRAAAEELYRAGWAYAVAIDHRPLMAKLRLHLSSLAYWNGRPREAADLATSGLEYLRFGPTGIQLHLEYGRAIAELGETDLARQAITEADEAREHEYRDDLMEIGGEFDLSRASERYLTGSVLIEVPAAASDAVTVLERAAELYAVGPGPDETHGFGMEALAHINLAEARLRTGGIEAASAALGPVLSLPSGKRIHPIPRRLVRVRAELHAPVFRGSVQARDLDEQIEVFDRESVTAGLHSLPEGPS